MEMESYAAVPCRYGAQTQGSFPPSKVDCSEVDGGNIRTIPDEEGLLFKKSK